MKTCLWWDIDIVVFTAFPYQTHVFWKQNGNIRYLVVIRLVSVYPLDVTECKKLRPEALYNCIAATNSLFSDKYNANSRVVSIDLENIVFYNAPNFYFYQK